MPFTVVNTMRYAFIHMDVVLYVVFVSNTHPHIRPHFRHPPIRQMTLSIFPISNSVIRSSHKYRQIAIATTTTTPIITVIIMSSPASLANCPTVHSMQHTTMGSSLRQMIWKCNDTPTSTKPLEKVRSVYSTVYTVHVYIRTHSSTLNQWHTKQIKNLKKVKQWQKQKLYLDACGRSTADQCQSKSGEAIELMGPMLKCWDENAKIIRYRSIWCETNANKRGVPFQIFVHLFV